MNTNTNGNWLGEMLGRGLGCLMTLGIFLFLLALVVGIGSWVLNSSPLDAVMRILFDDRGELSLVEEPEEPEVPAQERLSAYPGPDDNPGPVGVELREVGCDASEYVFFETLITFGATPTAVLPAGHGMVVSMDPGSISVDGDVVMTSGEGILYALYNSDVMTATVQVNTGWNASNGRYNVHACIFETPNPDLVYQRAWEWQGLPSSTAGEQKPEFEFLAVYEDVATDAVTTESFAPSWPINLPAVLSEQ